jgi:hypothetical protein
MGVLGQATGSTEVTTSPTGEQLVVKTSPTPKEGVPIISEKEGEKRSGTRPWYKTYKLWLLIGTAVGVAGAGTATYVVIRRRRRTK